MYLDWRGKEIKVGSSVVWPGRGSTEAYINEGIVTAIIPVERNDYISDLKWKFNLKIKTLGREQRWSGDISKPVKIKIGRVDRVTVVEPRNA